MKIGFDAKRAAQNKTGLGNYSRFVIESLAETIPVGRYLLYVPHPGKTACMDNLLQRYNVDMRCPRTGFWKRLRSLWRVWGVTPDFEQDRIRLFHGLSNELPLNIRKARRVRSVVTIHDLIFLRHPEYYPYIDRKIYAYKFRKACQNADRIIAVSQCTKQDIIDFFHIPEEKIDVVYQGCDASFKRPVDAEKKESVRRKYRLPSRYILYVGSIEERKNLMLVAQALPFLPDGTEVIAVGKRTRYADKVETFLRRNGLEHRMRLVSDVPFDDLPAFYQMASVFVYPSKFEGFGIPLLEALNSGTPAIGATGS
ncbi:glycosyltransferase family 4 protein, partial [Bacteroides heparinolyticus]